MEDFEQLRIVRIESGGGEWRSAGRVDRKCIPFAILVQPLRGWYHVSAGGRHLRILTGDAVLLASDEPVEFEHHDDAAGWFGACWLHVQAVLVDALDPCLLALDAAPDLRPAGLAASGSCCRNCMGSRDALLATSWPGSAFRPWL